MNGKAWSALSDSIEMFPRHPSGQIVAIINIRREIPSKGKPSPVYSRRPAPEGSAKRDV